MRWKTCRKVLSLTHFLKSDQMILSSDIFLEEPLNQGKRFLVLSCGPDGDGLLALESYFLCIGEVKAQQGFPICGRWYPTVFCRLIKNWNSGKLFLKTCQNCGQICFGEWLVHLKCYASYMCNVHILFFFSFKERKRIYYEENPLREHWSHSSWR